MKSFSELILEESLSIQDALNILSISAQDAKNSELLKKAYRQASMKAHPDLGGSNEQMKMVNAANEVLKKGSSSYRKEDFKKTREDNIKKFKNFAVLIKNDILTKFDSSAFVSYFTSIFNTPFIFEMKKIRPQNIERDYSYAGFIGEFFDKNRNTIMTLDIWVDVVSTSNNANKLGASDLTYTMMITAYLLHNNKKQKLTKSDYNLNNHSDVFKKPELIFPKAKLEKISSGEQRKGSKFSKRDMETILKLKLKADRNDNYFFIPIGSKTMVKDGFEQYLTIYRTVFLKQPYWHITNITQKKAVSGKRFGSSEKFNTKTASFPETEETSKFFIEMVNKIENETDGHKIVNIVNSMIEKYTAKLQG